MEIKTCSCGKKFDWFEWLDLKRIGFQEFNDIGECFEMRNCPCGSTLAWPVHFSTRRRLEVAS